MTYNYLFYCHSRFAGVYDALKSNLSSICDVEGPYGAGREERKTFIINRSLQGCLSYIRSIKRFCAREGCHWKIPSKGVVALCN